MTGVPLVHRFTRTAASRRLYDALAAAGLTATIMDEWVRGTAEPPRSAPPEGVTLDRWSAAAAADAAEQPLDDGNAADQTVTAAVDEPAFDELAADDVAVVAMADGRVVGRAFVSGRPVDVAPLERRVDVDGAYLWRVYVAPDFRRQGVAAALVGAAVDAARAVHDADRCVALVAADNLPSQRTFAAAGFERTRRRTYVRVGPWRLRRTAD